LLQFLPSVHIGEPVRLARTSVRMLYEMREGAR